MGEVGYIPEDLKEMILTESESMDSYVERMKHIPDRIKNLRTSLRTGMSAPPLPAESLPEDVQSGSTPALAMGSVMDLQQGVQIPVDVLYDVEQQQQTSTKYVSNKFPTLQDIFQSLDQSGNGCVNVKNIDDFILTGDGMMEWWEVQSWKSWMINGTDRALHRDFPSIYDIGMNFTEFVKMVQSTDPVYKAIQLIIKHIREDMTRIPIGDKSDFEWFLKAAEKGDQFQGMNMYELGLCYEEGTGCEIDLDQAMHWYQKSAAQEYQDAIDAVERLSQDQ